MDWLFNPEIWISLATLTALEVVLGIDNIIFIAILAGKLPVAVQERARRTGLLAAMVMRVLLLLAINWIMGLKSELFHLFGHGFSGRDLILLLGGVFLIGKATHEIHDKLEGEDIHDTQRAAATFGGVIVQIMLLDIVFSLDSVITAVGMAQHLPVMIAAVVIAVGFMMFFAGTVSRFIEVHPTLKILALSFLLLVGVVLVADGLGHHINKGYIYFAMAFSVFVEALNLKMRSRQRRSRPTGPPPRSGPAS
ncbi:MAG: TerC family protein [Verrucomicrobiales bacterium]|nr:TerC family protein [Verrucomicrobiales bacterium]